MNGVNFPALRPILVVAVALLVITIVEVVVALGVGESPRPEDGPVVVFGDSLSAGYGLEPQQGWVALLSSRLSRRVINASVSGETTAGGRTRIDRVLEEHRPSILIVELGGNDGLRGLPLEATRKNLDDIITIAQSRNVQVLLLGMRLPPNYGPTYTERFEQIFVELADTHSVALLPFFLDGVALDPALMQADGIHPNASAQPILLDSVLTALQVLLGS